MGNDQKWAYAKGLGEKRVKMSFLCPRTGLGRARMTLLHQSWLFTISEGEGVGLRSSDDQLVGCHFETHYLTMFKLHNFQFLSIGHIFCSTRGTLLCRGQKETIARVYCWRQNFLKFCLKTSEMCTGVSF